MKNIKVEIRPMIEEDMDFIVHANKEVHESSNQTNEVIEFKKRLMVDVLSEKPKAYVVTAVVNNEPIGMALYSTVYFADEGQIMWLSNIFVKDEFRNKKIAKAIVKYLQNVCKEKGYYAICGAVEENNITSKNFFNSINSKWLKDFNMFVIKQ